MKKMVITLLFSLCGTALCPMERRPCFGYRGDETPPQRSPSPRLMEKTPERETRIPKKKKRRNRNSRKRKRNVDTVQDDFEPARKRVKTLSTLVSELHEPFEEETEYATSQKVSGYKRGNSQVRDREYQYLVTRIRMLQGELQIFGKKIMIVLNGVTGSGKSSMSKVLTKLFDNWVHLDRDDHINEHFVPHILSFYKDHYQWHEPRPLRCDTEENIALVRDHPNKYQDIKDFVGNHNYELQNFLFEKNIIQGFLKRALDEYAQGKNVIVEAPFPSSSKEYEEWMLRLGELIDNHEWTVYFVGVDCDVKELQRRMKKRKNRLENLIIRQVGKVHAYETEFKKFRKQYDYMIDTTKKNPIVAIIELLNALLDRKPTKIVHNSRTVARTRAQRKLKGLVANNMDGLREILLMKRSLENDISLSEGD